MADRLTGSGMGAGGGDADLGSGDRPVAPGQWNPAFGRSSRDLASDSPPAGAPHGMMTDPDTDNETFSDPDAVTGGPPLPGRKPRRPDLDPDARLGLAPVVAGGAAPDLPRYPESDAVTRMATGAVAGVIGSGTLAAILYVLFWTGAIPLPSFVAASRAWLGAHGVIDHLIGLAGSLIAGSLWGLLFGLLFTRPTTFKGMLFGLLPTFALWLVLVPLMGRPVFQGGNRAALALPLLFNVVVWGGITGALCWHWLRPPYTTDVAPAAAGA